MTDHLTSGPGSTDTGQLLREWRERALLTQEQLAERAGLSVRSIRRFERGGSAQSTSIRMLADALGLSAEERALLVTPDDVVRRALSLSGVDTLLELLDS